MTDNSKNLLEPKIWFEAPKGEPKAVVLLLHGLNLKPTKMDDWSHMLQEASAYVYRFALYGHTGDNEEMGAVNQDIWRQQFKIAADIAAHKSLELKVPLYFVGFSLGALVALEWMSLNDGSKKFDKMVLIAPAISLPWYSRVAINTVAILGKGFTLPSRSPQGYRANRGTSVAAYQSLFAIKDSLEAHEYKNANVETLVIVDRQDELVNSRGIRDIIKKFKLGLWTLEFVDNRYAYDNFGFRHLMVDREAVGKDLWHSLALMVKKHLDIL